MFSLSPPVWWWKRLFFPNLALPPPSHTMLLQGGHFEHTDPTLYGGGGGGGGRGEGMVKLSKKAKCTITFDQDCSPELSQQLDMPGKNSVRFVYKWPLKSACPTWKSTSPVDYQTFVELWMCIIFSTRLLDWKCLRSKLCNSHYPNLFSIIIQFSPKKKTSSKLSCNWIANSYSYNHVQNSLAQKCTARTDTLYDVFVLLVPNLLSLPLFNFDSWENKSQAIPKHSTLNGGRGWFWKHAMTLTRITAFNWKLVWNE